MSDEGREPRSWASAFAIALLLSPAAAVACNGSGAKQPDGTAPPSSGPVPTSSAAPPPVTATSAVASAAPAPSASAAASTATTTTATAPGAVAMLPDDAIKAAIAGKQEILVVRVKKVDGAAGGTRSEMTTYTLEVVRSALAGTASSTGAVRLSHYGAPRLSADRPYVISTREGNPQWGTKGLRESVEIAAGQEEAAAKAHAAKAKALGAP
jgi:hypothetical protein